MKELELNYMETLKGGEFEASSFITGVCAGWGVGAWLGAVALSGPAVGVIIGACAANTIGGSLDWW